MFGKTRATLSANESYFKLKNNRRSHCSRRILIGALRCWRAFWLAREFAWVQLVLVSVLLHSIENRSVSSSLFSFFF